MKRSNVEDDDGDIGGPSQQSEPKKPSPEQKVKESEDQVEQEDQEEEEEEEEEIEDDDYNDGQDQEPNNKLDSIKPINPVSVITLTEPGHPGVLDCPICYEPLTVPVFQCDDNGHLICSSCQFKIYKCPLCSGPFGSKRCRVIEKFLESSTSCQNNQLPPVRVITLTEPTLLDCSICKEPLNIPVFQCDHNEHAACSSCISKKLKYPPGTSSFGGRCRIIEIILESSTTLCRNINYGCKETMTSTSKEHEKACMHSPCTCPHSGCNFVSSARSLYKHFKSNHVKSAKRFVYNSRFSVRIIKNIHIFLVLQEKNEGTLFTFENHFVECAGNVLRVTCIQPRFMKGAPFELVAEKDEGNSLKLDAFTKSSPNPVNDAPPSSSYFCPPTYGIPCDFLIHVIGSRSTSA